MANTEEFTHYQPLGNSDPAHTAYGTGALAAATPVMTPLMLEATAGKLVAWDGEHAGAACGILAVAADQNSTELTFINPAPSVLKIFTGRMQSPTTASNVMPLLALLSALFNRLLYHFHYS